MPLASAGFMLPCAIYMCTYVVCINRMCKLGVWGTVYLCLWSHDLTTTFWCPQIWEDVWAQFPYLVIVSMLFIAQFYLENAAQSKLDVNRVAKVSSLFLFLVGPLLTFLWAAPIDHGLVHHMSAGVVLAVILFLIGG